jgi:hypothetical protein
MRSGYKLLTAAPHTLRVDGGLGYTDERRLTGEDLSFPLANLGAAYKWQISTNADLTNAALYTLSLDEGEDWRFANTIALTAAINSVFSLKASHELKHLNAPVPGSRRRTRSCRWHSSPSSDVWGARGAWGALRSSSRRGPCGPPSPSATARQARSDQCSSVCVRGCVCPRPAFACGYGAAGPAFAFGCGAASPV